MRITGVWNGSKGGVPYVNPDRYIEDPQLKESMLGFLRGGAVVMVAAGLGEDWLAEGHPVRVPIGYCTDGTWIWDMAVTYYLEHHDVCPTLEFVEHMRSYNFHAPAVSDAQLKQAFDKLTSGS